MRHADKSRLGNLLPWMSQVFGVRMRRRRRRWWWWSCKAEWRRCGNGWKASTARAVCASRRTFSEGAGRGSEPALPSSGALRLIGWFCLLVFSVCVFVYLLAPLFVCLIVTISVWWRILAGQIELSPLLFVQSRRRCWHCSNAVKPLLLFLAAVEVKFRPSHSDPD